MFASSISFTTVKDNRQPLNLSVDTLLPVEISVFSLLFPAEAEIQAIGRVQSWDSVPIFHLFSLCEALQIWAVVQGNPGTWGIWRKSDSWWNT